MLENKTYIKSYCTIQNNQINLNSNPIFELESSISFQDFSKQAYQKFNFNYPKFFKMDNLSKLAFLAAELILKPEINETTENNIALVFTNKSSSLDTDIKYQESISNPRSYFPSPAIFVYTLPNICIGEISIKNQLKSENSFFIFDNFNPHFIQQYVNLLITTKKAEKVVAGWVEFNNNQYKVFLYLIDIIGEIEHTQENLKTLYNK